MTKEERMLTLKNSYYEMFKNCIDVDGLTKEDLETQAKESNISVNELKIAFWDALDMLIGDLKNKMDSFIDD